MKLTGIIVAIASTVIIGLSTTVYFVNKSNDKLKKDLIVLETAMQIEQARQTKEKIKADAENKTAHNKLVVANKRLRDQIATSALTPGPRDAALVCFDRTEFDRAIRKFVEGTGGLIGKGAEAITDLNTARRWAQQN